MTPLPNIRALRAFLSRGGVIAYPTESCFGLGCDPANRRAVKRILRLKGRPQSKGLILIGAEIGQFERYLASVPQPVAARLQDWWPGPNTLLLPRARHCPRWLSGRHDTLAVRVTAHRESVRLCQALRMALVSTSANRSGERPIKSARACAGYFGSQVLVLPGRIGQDRRPSRILEPLSGKVWRA